MVYISESGNHRIRESTCEHFGGPGEREGELNWPVGIAVDKQGIVYVSEYDNNHISFTSEGQFIKAFGGLGHDPGQFERPRGMAVDSSVISLIYRVTAF